ncbi:MAG: glycine cleavage system protein GcvH [Chloroflexia bacterium]|nr:glycine cleavage system protein GcvH [Chloroflexia bacterium]
MNVPADLRYTEEHEWARLEGDTVVVGITDHAQSELGDVVYVELPEIGETYDQGESFGVVESVKATSELYAPVGGEVVELNEALLDDPAVVNTDAYGVGWMVRFKVDDVDEFEQLLDADAYKALLD